MNPLRLLLLTSSLVLSAPIVAHETVRGGDVAGLLHVEPDDAPRAGKNVTVWFELTQRGGKALSPSSMTLRLKVFQGQNTAKALLTPNVGVGAVGEARGKPSATLRFPRTGAYTVVLEGSPKKGVNLKPFTLRFDVNAVR